MENFMLKLTLNGKALSLDADPAMPLLYAIRDIAELTGTKFGCGMGLCGACTVHLDGEPIRSCVTPLSAAQGKEITTIEGLANDQELHPLQAAWVANKVPQCGYCQSGQIMSAAALLDKNAAPSDSDIEEAMQGNICRCGTYPRIKKAIKEAATNLQKVKA
ncbi:MAG: isoquinoline 1-oxidoreductase alpha subunit [Arenicella sp.]